MKVPKKLRQNSKQITTSELQTKSDNRLFNFGSLCVNERDRLLLHDGRSLPLTAKVFDLLLVLIKNRPHLVPKSKLLQEVWPNTFVEEANLAVYIARLRKALGKRSSRHIVTVPKHGYRFSGIVTETAFRESEEPKSGSEILEGSEAPVPTGLLPVTSRTSRIGTNYILDDLTHSIVSNISRLGRMQSVSHSSMSTTDVVILIRLRLDRDVEHSDSV